MRPWAQFRTEIARDVRTRELTNDPNASIRSQVVNLPAGRALQTISVYQHQPSHQHYRVVYYDFWKEGVFHEVQYVCLAKLSGVYVPIFDRSARSIRFTT
jgi:hypothetical protein